MVNLSIYKEHGFESRRDYINFLADENGIDRIDLYTVANLLGPEEDFDGLVCAVDDIKRDRGQI